MSDAQEFVIVQFHTAYDAFATADIAQLEEMTVRSPFPCGMDGWLGRHWLSTAISTGQPDAVAWVLSKGPKVNYVDDEGFTALTACVHFEQDSRLLSPPLDPEDATERVVKMIDLLCAAGADINLGGTLEETALHAAALWSSPKVVQHLLARGADPTLWDREHVPRQPADYAKDKKRWEVHAILRMAMGEAPDGRMKKGDR